MHYARLRGLEKSPRGDQQASFVLESSYSHDGWIDITDQLFGMMGDDFPDGDVKSVPVTIDKKQSKPDEGESSLDELEKMLDLINWD